MVEALIVFDPTLLVCSAVESPRSLGVPQAEVVCLFLVMLLSSLREQLLGSWNQAMGQNRLLLWL